MLFTAKQNIQLKRSVSKKRKYALVTSFLIFLFFFNSASANDPESPALKESRVFSDQGIKAIARGDYPQAMIYFTKAEVIAQKIKSAHEILYIKINIGRIYCFLSNYGEALGYYQQALEIIKKNPALRDMSPMVLNNIGILYLCEKDDKNALLYYEKAYSQIVDGSNTDYIKLGLAINIADIYNRSGNFKKAREYLNKVKPSGRHKSFQIYWNINYAESLLVEGRASEAQKMMEEILQKLDTQNYRNEYFDITYLLTKIYAKQHKMGLAIAYANKALKISTIMKNRVATFEELSKIYSENKNYALALQYKDSMLIAKDSMAVLVNQGLFESNKVRLKIQDYQNELKINSEKNASERKIFILIIVFSLIFFFFIYRALKNRITKQKQQKIIDQNQQRIFQLELDNLKNNIGEKNRKLSAKALYLSGRNELIEEIIDKLSQISVVSENKEVSKYIKTLREYVKTDSEWEEFVAHFEKVNPGLLKVLKVKHPELTAKDIRFLCYVYMNLDAKELSIVFNITPDACRRRERRLLKKMGLDSEGSLFEYLLEVA